MKQQKDLQIETDFQEKYKQLSDPEILEILKLRNGYQPKAANAAIQEAISRGIIKSEQDLFSEEYRNQENRSGFFFPSIQNTQQKEKILSSIHRIIYILGIIPLVFAGLDYSHGNIIRPVILAGIAFCWWVLNFRLSKTKNKIILDIMLVILIVAFGYSFFLIYNLKSPPVMDFVVVSITFLTSLYCLLFSRSILKG